MFARVSATMILIVALVAPRSGLASTPDTSPPDSRPPREAWEEDPVLRAQYDAIGLVRRSGKKRAAAIAFESFAAQHPRSSLAPRALNAAATIYHWDLGDFARAATLYDRVLGLGESYQRPSRSAAKRAEIPDGPKGGLASALRGRLALARDAEGAAGEVAVLRELLIRRWDDDFAAFMRMRAAHLLADELSDLEGALKQLEVVRTLHARSGRSDEAAMFQGEILRRQARPQAAILAYRSVVSTRSKSFIVGDYDSTMLDDAHFQIAETLRRDLGDPRAAEDAYLDLVKARPLSRLVDDALERAAELAEARGDLEEARKRRERLVQLAPDSRYLSRRRKP